MRINVLDKGWVELLDSMGGEHAIAAAAGESYGRAPDDAERIVADLLRKEHGTPFEHAVLTFRARAPELVFRQWVRHRIGTFNVQSRRYTEVGEDDFYMPDVWNGVWDGGMRRDLGVALQKLIDDGLFLYKMAMNMGVPREQARLFLPGYAVYSTFRWTVNARSLMNFLKQRLGAGAQWETQEYARAAWKFFESELPTVAETFRGLNPGLEYGE